MSSQWFDQAKSLYERLEITDKAFSSVSAQRIENLALLEKEQDARDELERKFWLAMSEQGLLNGGNEDKRKEARQRAYNDHADDEPYQLNARVKQITHLKTLCDGLEIEFVALSKKLAAFATQVELLRVLIEHEPPSGESTMQAPAPVEIH